MKFGDTVVDVSSVPGAMSRDVKPLAEPCAKCYSDPNALKKAAG